MSGPHPPPPRRAPRDRSRLMRLIAFALFTLIVMIGLTDGRFLSSANFESMAFQFPELGLLSFAMMLSMLSGGIDLSIVSIANLSGVAAAVVMTRTAAGRHHDRPGLAVMGPGFSRPCAAASCAAGSTAGSIGVVGVSPILATLGTMQLFFGAAVAWTGGKAVIGLPEGLQQIGNGSFAGVPVPLWFFLSACGRDRGPLEPDGSWGGIAADRAAIAPPAGFQRYRSDPCWCART